MVSSAPRQEALSRLEVNFLRVLREAQLAAAGRGSGASWTLEKLWRCRRVVVLYGSATGTAEEVAGRVAREARRRWYTPLVLPMNAADLPVLRGTLPGVGDEEAPASLPPAAKEVVLQCLQDAARSFDIHSCASKEAVDASQGSSLAAASTTDVTPDSDKKSSETVVEDALEKLSLSPNVAQEHMAFFKRVCALLPPVCVVFVAATTGQGDDPDNMKEFFAALWRQRHDRHLLAGVRYGVLALGDSSYQKFNYSGKRLNNLLRRLGATPLLDIGLADDQHDLGPDFVVDAWLPRLWSELEVLCPLPDGVPPLAADTLPPPRWRVQFLDSEEHISVSAPQVAAEDDFLPCALTRLERLTAPTHFQDVRLVEFDVGGLGRCHRPGDVLYIKPENLPVHVAEFMQVLGLRGARRLRVLAEDAPRWLQTGCSVEQCVARYFDIMAVPRRSFFELLSFFTSDEQEKEKFLEFASAGGQQDLYDYCNRPKRSIVEVLADFPGVNVPFEYLFDLVPRMKPRAYSVASSSVMRPHRAQALVAVVQYRTNLRRPRLGVCSNWLASLPLGNPVLLTIKKGSLPFPLPEHGQHTPANASEPSPPLPQLPPVIMIAPGTGVAPFRAYIEERVALGLTDAPMLLFFGCRNRCADFFFAREWEEYNGALELYTAFSRDQEHKVYVQHRICEQAARLWPLISAGRAVVFLAGNARRVPIDVHEALSEVCRLGLRDDGQAEEFVKRELSKRYHTETWA